MNLSKIKFILMNMTKISKGKLQNRNIIGNQIKITFSNFHYLSYSTVYIKGVSIISLNV